MSFNFRETMRQIQRKSTRTGYCVLRIVDEHDELFGTRFMTRSQENPPTAAHYSDAIIEAGFELTTVVMVQHGRDA